MGTAAGCTGTLQIGVAGYTTADQVTILTFQGSTLEELSYAEVTELYTNSSSLTITGICSEHVDGVSFLDLKTSRQLGETAECQKDLSFSWTLAAADEGEYEIQYQTAYRGSGVLPASVFKKVIVDRTSPAEPVVTTAGAPAITSTTSTFILSGTVEDGILSVVATGGGVLDFTKSETHFDYQITLAPGETRTMTFAAKDFAGNISALTSATVSYSANLKLDLIGFSGLRSGALRTGVGHGDTLETLSLNPFSQAPNPTSSGGGKKLSRELTQINSDVD